MANNSSIADTLGAEPARVFRPDTAPELADAVRDAGAAGLAVIPHGGGTGQDYGYPPDAPGGFALLDTNALNRIVAVEPGDLTITVEAGVTLAAVQAALAPHGLFLPLDPPNPEWTTVGGVLAVNATGASRLGYGTARDWLIGLTVIDGNGRTITGGGKVVKNVTGYDLPKLHVGALGTLGVITEATFKVAPLPETERTVVITLEPGEDAGMNSFVDAVLRSAAPTQGYWRTDGSGSHLVFVCAGFREAVDEGIGRIREQARSLEAEGATVSVFDERLDAREDAAPFSLRILGMPAGDAERHQKVAALAGDATVRTLLGSGITEVMGTEPARAADLLADGAAFTWTHALLGVRRAGLRVWSPEPRSLPLMRRMKAALDPERRLNPGRFVGRI